MLTNTLDHLALWLGRLAEGRGRFFMPVSGCMSSVPKGTSKPGLDALSGTATGFRAAETPADRGWGCGWRVPADEGSGSSYNGNSWPGRLHSGVAQGGCALSAHSRRPPAFRHDAQQTNWAASCTDSTNASPGHPRAVRGDARLGALRQYRGGRDLQDGGHLRPVRSRRWAATRPCARWRRRAS